MTWAVLIPIIIASLAKILITCLPTGVVEWIESKFQTHSKLNDANAIITFNGKGIEGKDKTHIINSFNESIFIEKHYIYPGNEEHFLYPDINEKPLVITSKTGKRDVRLFVYRYNDRIYVAKQCEKKVIAYSLFSEKLQKLSFS